MRLMKKAIALISFFILMVLLTSCLSPGDSVWAKKKGDAGFTPYNCSLAECKKMFSFEKGEELRIAEAHEEFGNKTYNEEMKITWRRVYNKDFVHGWIPEDLITTKPPN